MLDHPDVGRLELDYEAFTLPGTAGQQLIVYTADPASTTAGRLPRLVSIGAGVSPRLAA